MKFELIGFYGASEEQKKKRKNLLGTIHVYCIDADLDIRGIQVFKTSNSMFFAMPHFRAIDEDGNKVTYPHLRFTDKINQKKFMCFLHEVCKKKIEKELK